MLHRLGRVNSSAKRLLYLTHHSSVVVVGRRDCVVVCVRLNSSIRRLLMMKMLMAREVGGGQSSEQGLGLRRLVASYGAAAAEIGRVARHDRAPGLAQYGLGVFDFFDRAASNVVLKWVIN